MKKYRFSIKGLFIVTTVVSVLMAMAMWLKLFSNNWWTLGAIGLYFLVYLLVVTVFLGPGYLRDFEEFQTNRSRQRAARLRLESEAQILLEKLRDEKSKEREEAEESE